jgi:hypothetical protein
VLTFGSLHAIQSEDLKIKRRVSAKFIPRMLVQDKRRTGSRFLRMVWPVRCYWKWLRAMRRGCDCIDTPVQAQTRLISPYAIKYRNTHTDFLCTYPNPNILSTTVSLPFTVAYEIKSFHILELIYVNSEPENWSGKCFWKHPSYRFLKLNLNCVKFQKYNPVISYVALHYVACKIQGGT